MSDFEAGDLLDRFDQTLGAAERVGCVELVALCGGVHLAGVGVGVVVEALALGSLDVEISRERDCDDAAAIGRDVDEHDGVGSGAFGIFDGAGADLPAGSCSSVRADDQEGFVTVLSIGVDDVGRVRVQCGHLCEPAIGVAQITPDNPGERHREDGDYRDTTARDGADPVSPTHFAHCQARESRPILDGDTDGLGSRGHRAWCARSDRSDLFGGSLDFRRRAAARRPDVLGP